MKNNTKIRYIVGRLQDENGNIDNMIADNSFSSFDKANQMLQMFQSYDRQLPYFAKDLSKLAVYQRCIETIFTKLYTGKGK